MGTCNFSIPFSGNAEIVLTKAKAAIESQQGVFTGDANSGRFSVSVFGNSIKGSYRVNGQSLNITITDKPFIVPCSTIESLLRSKIS
jgi:hypothetical protein